MNISPHNHCSGKTSSSQFLCPKCGSTMDHRLKDGKFSQPRRCVNATCKARSFNLLRETAVTVDSQYLKLREAEVGSFVCLDGLEVDEIFTFLLT